MTTTIKIEIAPGDLIDKITILEIKLERIQDAKKLKNIRIEIEALYKARDENITPSSALEGFAGELKTVNEALWKIENVIRECEQNGNFGEKFVQLARSVYINNDKRANLKRQISILLGAGIIEEKSYTPYKPQALMHKG